MSVSSFKLLLIGMAAALLGSVADVLLLYSPQGGYELMNYRFFESISYKRLFLGHFIGVMCIPFELLGLYPVFEAIKPSGEKRAKILAGITFYVMILGVSYHAMMGLTGVLVHLQSDGLIPNSQWAEVLSQAKSFFEPLGFILFSLFAILSSVFSYVVAKKQTAFPRWMALFNPIVIYVFWLIFYQTSTSIGGAFLVAGFNLSLFVFMLLSAISLGFLKKPKVGL